MTMPDALPDVVLVPGGIAPAALTYGPLMKLLEGRARMAPKDLEVYAADSLPPGYTIEAEARAIGTHATSQRMDRFHLVGFSGGGAASLVFTALHPERVLSLALTEPAWIGNRGQTPAERAWWDSADTTFQLSDELFMRGFASSEMAPGVPPPPPPPGPAPDWMRLRPAGLRAMMRAFKSSDFEPRELARFTGPVYYAVGELSAPIYHAQAERLAEVLPDLTVEVYEGTSHMHPPHLAEPERYARALERLWAASETAR